MRREDKQLPDTFLTRLNNLKLHGWPLNDFLGKHL